MRTAGPNSVHNRHKISFPDQVKEVIRISDIVLETLDARAINKSRILELEALIKEKNKLLIHVITKVDLLPNKKVSEEILKHLCMPITISTKSRQGISSLRKRIYILSKKFNQHAQVHIGIIGYPNTGKSSLINILARRAVAPVSSHPGFTKGIRKIRFAKGILLLDTPGTIPSNENLFSEDQRKHTFLGVHNPENVKNPDLILMELIKKHPGKIEEYYKTNSSKNTEDILKELGKRWNLIKQKGEIDTNRTARKILKDWQKGKFRL